MWNSQKILTWVSILAGIATVVGVVVVLLPKEKDIFKDVTGKYQGKIEGELFELCLIRNGTDVIGTMTFPDSPVYVDYSGKINTEEGVINLNYKRSYNSPEPDSGKATIAIKESTETFSGYWSSAIDPVNRGQWELKKVTGDCVPRNWDGEDK